MPDQTSRSDSIKIQLPEGTLEATGSDEWLQKIRAALASVFGGTVVQLAASPRQPEGTSLQTFLQSSTVTDVRSLKDQKQPKDVVEMAAIVAYYLQNLAPGDERKSTIGASEITKYFGQAGFATSTAPGTILFRAKNAGYLDSAAHGQFKLNPVGYNLVTAGLPRSEASRKRTRPPSIRKRSAKK